MTSNPYRPQYTDVQRRRVESARQELLDRWNRDLRDGQPPLFRVSFEREVLNGNRLADEFTVSPASASFSAAWRHEMAANASMMVVEHGSCRFTVFVDHQYYLKRGVVPVSVDAECLSSTTMHVLGALAFVYASVYLLFMIQ